VPVLADDDWSRKLELDGGLMAKVTGIGGVFFKSTNDHKKLAEWYSQNLGIQLEPWGGAILRWADDKSEDHGLTVWHVAEKNTEWFSPSPSSFMINYRIDNLSELVAELKRNGVEILKGPESDENGKFAWILDPDGNKVELWEPMARDEKNQTLA
jgi:predicted enzyme related to lactoylglutathione lyase